MVLFLSDTSVEKRSIRDTWVRRSHLWPSRGRAACCSALGAAAEPRRGRGSRAGGSRLALLGWGWLVSRASTILGKPRYPGAAAGAVLLFCFVQRGAHCAARNLCFAVHCLRLTFSKLLSY